MDSKWAVHRFHAFHESTSRLIQFPLMSVFIWAIFALLSLDSFSRLLHLQFSCNRWIFTPFIESSPLPDTSKNYSFTNIKVAALIVHRHQLRKGFRLIPLLHFFLLLVCTSSLRLTFILGYCNNCILLACVCTHSIVGSRKRTSKNGSTNKEQYWKIQLLYKRLALGGSNRGGKE